MKKYLCIILTSLSFFSAIEVQAQDINKLTIKTRIDSIYVFGFDLTESRSAKGGIWNLKTGKPETPQNFTEAKPDTIKGKPVVLLYREVVRGNHPLNRWETWMQKEGKWCPYEEILPKEEKE